MTMLRFPTAPPPPVAVSDDVAPFTPDCDVVPLIINVVAAGPLVGETVRPRLFGATATWNEPAYPSCETVNRAPEPQSTVIVLPLIVFPANTTGAGVGVGDGDGDGEGDGEGVGDADALGAGALGVALPPEVLHDAITMANDAAVNKPAR